MFRTRPSKIFNPAAFYRNPADRKKVANGVMEEAVEGEQGSGEDNDDDADSMKYVLLQEEVDDGNGEEVKVDNNEETVDNGVNNGEEEPPELTPPVTPEIQTPSRSGRLSLSDAMLALLPPPKPQPPPVVVVELMPEPEPEHSIMVMMPIPGDRPVMAPDGDRDTSRDSMIKLDVKKIETEKLSKWGRLRIKKKFEKDQEAAKRESLKNILVFAEPGKFVLERKLRKGKPKGKNDKSMRASLIDSNED